MIAIPSAFTGPTGAAHWKALLRARAIETGCFILAPAQCGEHAGPAGPARRTWGRSMIVFPWGEALATAEEEGVIFAGLVSAAVSEARSRVPSLSGARVFRGA